MGVYFATRQEFLFGVKGIGIFFLWEVFFMERVSNIILKQCKKHIHLLDNNS